MRSKLWKVVGWFVAILLVSIGVPFAIWMPPYLKAKAELDRAVSACRAAGFFASPADLAPAPVPDEENAVPLLFRALSHDRGVSPRNTFAMKKVGSLTPDERAEVDSWLARNAEPFALVRQARAKPKARFNRDYASAESWREVRPADLMNLALDIAWKADVERVDGRVEEARESFRDALGIARALEGEPSLFIQQVRLIILNDVLLRIDRGVTSETTVGEIQGWLDLLPIVDDVATWMDIGARGELAWEMGLFTGPVEEIKRVFAPAPPNLLFQDEGPQPKFGLLSRASLTRDMARCLELVRRLAQVNGLPVQDRCAAAEAVAAEAQGLSAEIYPITTRWAPALSRYVWKHLRSLLRLAVVRGGLAMEISWAEKGAYGDPGLDPMTGRPLNVDSSMSVIYSSGPDGVDKFVVMEHLFTLPEWRLRRQK